MITASHNRFTDNGVKFFAAGGLKLADDVEEQIEAALAEGCRPPRVRARTRRWRAVITPTAGAVDEYVRRLVTSSRRCARGMRITVDCRERGDERRGAAALDALGRRRPR